jgi:phosphoketolase
MVMAMQAIPQLRSVGCNCIVWSEFWFGKLICECGDLYKLQPTIKHPTLNDREILDSLIYSRQTTDLSISTAIPWLIHRLAYRRTNHDNLMFGL